MIDLHSHILPGVDDGAADIGVSLEMARLAVLDGVTAMACTPHIRAGLYDNDAHSIVAAVTRLRKALAEADIPLELFAGADAHVSPDLPARLASGEVPTLNNSRYFLFEPTHHVLPPKIEELAMHILNTGFVPIITHPERLTWVTSHYAVLERLNDGGCLIQLTADSLTGAFGRRALYFAERLLDEGRSDFIASDAHGRDSRRPGLSRARDIASKRIGESEAMKMVSSGPADVVANRPLVRAGPWRRPKAESSVEMLGGLRRIFGVGS